MQGGAGHGHRGGLYCCSRRVTRFSVMHWFPGKLEMRLEKEGRDIRLLPLGTASSEVILEARVC